MPLIQSSVSVPANSIIDNVLAGSQFEFLPYDAQLQFGLTAGATGTTNLRIDVFSGQDILTEQFAPSTAARIPIYPDDYSLTDIAAAGERIKIRVRNLGGAAIDFFYAVKIDPVGL